MKKTFIPMYLRFALITSVLFSFILCLPALAEAQAPPADGFRLSPGRVQLEIPPGGVKTVVLHLQYNASQKSADPVRLMAYLNDWDTAPDGQVMFHKAGSKPRSASQWMIYSPAEAVVQPGGLHTIRVTVSVPKDAAPGDHLAALMIEPRSNNIKTASTGPQFRVSFRLGALFYITVPGATRKGSLEDLKAQVSREAIQIIPTIKNSGNSALRPAYTLKIVSESNETVFESELTQAQAVLGQSVQSRSIKLESELVPGNYKVFYKVNFNDGNPVVEGVTSFTVTAKSRVNLAQSNN